MAAPLLKRRGRRRLKVLEETYEQQQQSVKKQNEQLVAQLLSQSQDAEKARAELVAQHEERVAALQQQNMWDLECLREQQRRLVQTVVKDYEEQLQRLRQTKDLEVDAVTGPTSHTRSLNSIIEQMEKFSINLLDLSHKVEATQQTTSQELAQQRDKQLKGTSAVPLCQNSSRVPARAGDTQETRRSCFKTARGWEP
ncbi:fas-binding factor 1 homolog isoform X1 [Strigops habroptila]|uniref:fas-binding factor 1 homolog isoform X1 n=1 Tax=Strigops habroptila TaxID=2489341 RepID=UPI0011CFF570|nr:fas-binding factor 1 homolog isoform X1 [Strigops habroptila]